MYSYGKKDEVYGSETLFREVGYYVSRLELYDKSLKFFDNALQITPNDKRALIGRSRARAKTCAYAGALADANNALKLDPDDLTVLGDKALNTYLCCEFEEGLVQNTRLVRARQKPDNFAMGVMHCSNAIENCVGERAGRPLRDHFRMIRKLAWKKNYDSQKPYDPKPRKISKRTASAATQNGQEPITPAIARKTLKADTRQGDDDDYLSIKDSLRSQLAEDKTIPPYSQPFLFKPLQNCTTNIENYMAEKYLDSMYLDKIFLKKLQTEPGLVCPNVKGSAEIRNLAEAGFKRVAYKQELLRARRPFYYIKYQEATVSGALRLRQQQELEAHKQCTKREADHILMKMQDAYKEKKIRLMLDLVEKLKLYCDSKPKRLFIDKDVYLDQIYLLVRKGFYDLNRLNKCHFKWDQERRIRMAFGLPVSRDVSRDSVVNEFKNVFVDHKKFLKTFERRLKSAVSPEEICWCYHELSRHLIELKRYELARVYCRKCIQEGKICNLEWSVNGSMLLTKINIKQHNKYDARNEIVEVMKIAQELNDTRLQEYINMCLTVIDKIEFDDEHGAKVLEKREETIVSMMTSAKMKEDAKHLFRLMSVLPASRRMSVMPGVRIEDAEKKSKIARKLSIMPGPRSPRTSLISRTSTVSRAKGEKRDTKGSKDQKGIGFMDLIQYHVE